jgi:erythritol kinase
MKDILIGIDAGTSVIKSVAFDLKGRQLAVASTPNHYEAVGRAGSVQDLTRTWTDTASTLRQLATMIDDLPSRTAGVAVTGQGDGTWMIDCHGEPVGKGWLWLDARAGEIVQNLRTDSGDAERFTRTGVGLAACQQGPQLRWMMKHSPQILNDVATAFHCKDWLYFKLTGKRATDPSEANFSFGNFRNRQYDDEVIGFLGLERLRHVMPEIVDGSVTHHEITLGAADQTGLLSGTPIVLGYVDVVCTGLGAGLYGLGTDTGCSIIGSTGMHMRLAKSPDEVHLNRNLTGYTMCMPIPGVYAQTQSNMAATLNIDWILSVAASVLKGMGVEKSKAELLTNADRWLSDAKDNSLIFLPYISEAGERGPFVDATARASFVGLSIGHNFADLFKAVFDGLALAARDCYFEMGPLPSQIRLTGGAARSQSLRRILAAALGASVQTSEREEAGAAGAAMIAAVSLGIYRSMDECVKEWVQPDQRVAEQPDPELIARYDDLFPTYQKSRHALTPIWHALAADPSGQSAQQEQP